MALEKATIQRQAPPGGEVIEVLFNPNQYTLNKANQFSEVAIPGLGAPPIQFVRGTARTLSMQLFFDTYEQGTDVREFTGQITELLEVDSELHAPPICLFSWGDLSFLGVLESANQQFLLFLSDGTPARATMDISMKEIGEDQAGRLQSADFAKRYLVRQGDTLSSIAGEMYGDPAGWRPIANVNGVNDPLSLEPGRELVIPRLS